MIRRRHATLTSNDWGTFYPRHLASRFLTAHYVRRAVDGSPETRGKAVAIDDSAHAGVGAAQQHAGDLACVSASDHEAVSAQDDAIRQVALPPRHPGAGRAWRLPPRPEFQRRKAERTVKRSQSNRELGPAPDDLVVPGEPKNAARLGDTPGETPVGRRVGARRGPASTRARMIDWGNRLMSGC